MTNRSRFALIAVGLLSTLLAAQEAKPPMAKPKYKGGDMTRPRPAVIDPGSATKAPSDAIVLFDGKDLSAWQASGKAKPDNPEKLARWKVENGYFEITPRTGGIETKEKFGNIQLHIEWAAPAEVKGNGQGRGNSGVYMGSFGEVQVLDSYNNDTYPDGQAAGLYGRFPPLVNASRKPGEWQVYDIIAHQSKQDDSGKVVKPGHLTVLHNGVAVHHAVEFGNKMGPFTLNLQDHGNPVRFRNVWVRKLKDYDEDGTPPPPLPEKK